jgi:hypothetical protein
LFVIGTHKHVARAVHKQAACCDGTASRTEIQNVLASILLMHLTMTGKSEGRKRPKTNENEGVWRKK